MQGGTLNCQGLHCKQKLFPLLATGGPPGLIQRSRNCGIGRRNGEIHKAATESGVPGFCFTPVMFFMVKLPFLILHILSIPVKPFGCGYAALSPSW